MERQDFIIEIKLSTADVACVYTSFVGVDVHTTHDSGCSKMVLHIQWYYTSKQDTQCLSQTTYQRPSIE